MLLDTNALLWVYKDSHHLGTAARRRIESAGRVHYSPVSVAEIVIKHMLGRFDLPGGARFPSVFPSSGLVELRFNESHADGMRAEPSLTRHDPFDRMLLAQARGEGIELVTSDRTLLGLGYSWLVDART